MADTSIDMIESSVAAAPEWPKTADAYDIMFVIGQLSCGGTERQLSLLTSELAARGYQIAVAVAVSHSIESFLAPIEANATVFRLDQGLGSSLKLPRAFRLRRLVTKCKPGVVHSMSFRTNWLASFACTNSRSVSVGSFRSDFDSCRKRYGPLLWALNSRWPRHHVFNSIVSATKARNHRGLFRPRVVEFVRNAVGVVPQLVPANEDHAETMILGVGRLTDSKRWDRLIRLAARIKSSGRKIRVAIAGEGPFRSSLESEVDKHSVSDIFTFQGEVADISRSLSECDIVVHTSTIEGTPNALMEAMAIGKPVVSTDAGDISNLVGASQSGFVVNQDDEDALFERTCNLIDDPNLRAELGDHGRSVANEEFGVGRMVDSMLRVYCNAGWSADLADLC